MKELNQLRDIPIMELELEDIKAIGDILDILDIDVEIKPDCTLSFLLDLLIAERQKGEKANEKAMKKIETIILGAQNIYKKKINSDYKKAIETYFHSWKKQNIKEEKTISDELERSSLTFWKEKSLLIIDSLKTQKEILEMIQNRPYDKDIIYISIAVELFKQGKEKEAFEIIERMSYKEYKDNACYYIAVELYIKGRKKESLELLKEINETYSQSNVYHTIAVELFRQGKEKEAFEIIERIEERDKTIACEDIVIELYKQGREREGLELLKKVNLFGDYKRKRIAIGLFKQGKEEEGLKIVRKIKDEFLKASAYEEISVELARNAKIEKALEMLGKIEEEKNMYLKDLGYKEIAIELVKQGKEKEAVEVLGKIKIEDLKDEFYRDFLVEKFKKALKFEKENVPRINEIEIADLISKAINKNMMDIPIMFGAKTTLEQKEKILQNIPNRKRSLVTLLMDYGRTTLIYLPFLSKEEKYKIFSNHLKDLDQAISNPSQNQLLLKIVVYLLQNLETNEVKSHFIKIVKSIENSSAKFRILKALIEIDNIKGCDIALQVAAEPSVNRHLSRYLFLKLSKQGYIDEKLVDYLNKNSSYYLEALKILVNKIGVHPNVEILDYFTQKGLIKNLLKRSEKIIEKRKMFESVKNKEELIKMLVDKEEDLMLYYMLFGSRTSYEHVKKYDSSNLKEIIKEALELQVSNSVIEEFSHYLKIENKKQVISALKEGKWPFFTKSEWKIYLDLIEDELIKNAKSRFAQIMGNTEIGAIIKYMYYLKYLSSKKPMFVNKLKAINGLADLEPLLLEIETNYPTIKQSLSSDTKMISKIKRLAEKMQLNIELEEILQNPKNNLDIKTFFKAIENQRKILINSIIQKYKNKGLRKEEKEELIKEIEKKEKAKLFRDVLYQVIADDKTNDEKLNLLLDEFEAHLNAAVLSFEEAQKEAKFKIDKQIIEARIRYLDKKQDLIECFRIGDSFPCCFNSTGITGRKWVSRLWVDPLSFMFQIEVPIDEKKVNAIGFVFGSFGVINKNELAIMLNGVYLNKKSQENVEMILKIIEENFSSLFGAKWQVCAAKFGGFTTMPKGYTNDRFSIKRFRAIENNKGIEKILYDDLGKKCNVVYRVDGDIWRKEIKS